MRRLAWALCLGVALLPRPCPSESERAGGFEVRAAWVTRWAFKEPGDVGRLFAGLSEAGVNTVFFQVRGACDALYRSSLEPWSDLLTGRLGGDPGWDPLSTAIQEGHARGMEVHVWMNVFTAWPVSDRGTPPPVSKPLHIFRAHPEWLACDKAGRTMALARDETKDNYAFLSPTNRGVQDHIAAVVEDLAGRYDIDGLHLDYVRFPDSTYSFDADSKAAYRLDAVLTGPGHEGPTFHEWRVRRLTDFVGRLAAVARAARPGVKVSAAVWQKIDDGRTTYLQDGLEWKRLGHVDFLVPMIYTPDVETFGRRLRAYTGRAGAAGVVAGLGPYMDAFTDSIVAAELDTARADGVLGYSIFNSDYAMKYGAILRCYADR
jgi:uncharacterized lipoprotein YddW (UPF0748 family)